MTEADPIATYHAGQASGDQTICDQLRGEINAALPESSSKIWHAHPV